MMEAGMSTVICQALKLPRIDMLSDHDGACGEQSVSLNRNTCVFISLVSERCGEFSRLSAPESPWLNCDLCR
jgi:hypothetical protein